MKILSENMKKLWRIVKNDRNYANMNREFLYLEDQFALIVGRLSKKEQDVVWEYVCLSGAMNWRIMEIVCEKMEFSSAPIKNFVRN